MTGLKATVLTEAHLDAAFDYIQKWANGKRPVGNSRRAYIRFLRLRDGTRH